jgi:hypothetical protein
MINKIYTPSSKAHVILVKFEFKYNFIQIFEKSSNTKFRGNPSSGNWVVLCGRTDTTKLSLFRSFANAPKNAESRNECKMLAFQVA